MKDYFYTIWKLAFKYREYRGAREQYLADKMGWGINTGR